MCCSAGCFKKQLCKDPEYKHAEWSLGQMTSKIDQSLSLEYLLKNFNEIDAEKQKVDQELQTKLKRQLTSLNTKSMSMRSDKLDKNDGKSSNPFNILNLG